MRSMAQGLFCVVRRLAALAFVVILSGCDDGTPSGPRAGDRIVVVTESGAATTKSIGPAGGTIQVTGSNGITYTLEISANALLRDTAITMTPVREIQNLPLSGGLVAAVDFKPSGLAFVNPATLTITTAARPTGDLKMVGLSYTGTGDSLGLALIQVGANEVRFTVTHFSGLGLGFGTTQDVQALALAAFGGPPVPSLSQFYINNLAVLQLQTPRDATPELQVLEDWFDDVVLPALRNATTDAQLVLAFSEFFAWQSARPSLDSLFSPNPTLDAREAQWESQELGPKVGQAIAGNLQLCATQGTIASAKIAALDNAIFWMTTGLIFGAGPAGSFPDLATFPSVSCARVVTVSVVPPPNPMQVGFPHSLDITFGLLFGSDPTPVPANFRVTVFANNATVGTPQGLTALSPPGFFTTVVTAQSSSVFLAVTGCFADVFLNDVLCHTENIFGSAGEVISVGGAVQQISAPVSVVEGVLESDNIVRLFRESSATLSADLNADITVPGTYRTSLSPGTIPAGTRVVSYFLHYDRIGSPNSDRIVSGSVTFGLDILGISATDPSLNASDFLGATGTSYPNSGREVGINPGSTDADAVTLSADRRTISFTLEVRGMDQIRVILRQ